MSDAQPAGRHRIEVGDTAADAGVAESRVRRGWARRSVRVVGAVLLVLLLAQLGVTIRTWMVLRDRTTQPTAFMLADRERAAGPGLSSSLRTRMANPAWEWVPIASVSEDALVVLLSREDQEFPSRSMPFSVGQFVDRARTWVTGADEGDPWGSTIPQQVAKNLFTSGSRSAWRKAVEANYSFHLLGQLTNREILETYVNSIEFGPGIWGVCAASWYYYDRAPATLSRGDMAALVGMMPNPKVNTIFPASAPVRFAQENVDGYVRSLVGGNRAQVLSDLVRADPPEEATGCRTMPDSLATYLRATTDRAGFPLYAGDQWWWARTTCQYRQEALANSVAVSRAELARRSLGTPCGSHDQDPFGLRPTT